MCNFCEKESPKELKEAAESFHAHALRDSLW